MKKSKKIISLLLVSLMMLSSFSVVSFADSKKETDYTIINPYKDVDWETWKPYKANLHTHCTASDGRVDLPDMIEAYYKAGYDILALTDHGVINNGWNKPRKVHPPFNLLQKLTTMSDADYKRITTGSDRGGRGMIDIPGGIETNMAVITKTHVNGYFTTAGSGEWGIENDYKTACVNVENSTGYTVLNHVGDWTDSQHYPERAHNRDIIAYFADIFTSCKSCLGMEIVNSADNVSRMDRVFWDELLKVVIPTGRTVLAFSNDDSEYLDEVGRDFEYFYLKENTVENVRSAMVNGNFFACSKLAKTEISDSFFGTGEVPLVSKIVVNQEENTIEVTPDPSRDCDVIEWIYDSKVIATGNKIDLNDYEDQVGCYIRFQMKGKGGITYSQAFELKYDGRVEQKVNPNPFWNTFLGKLVRKVINTRAFAICQIIAEKINYKINF